RGPRAPRYPFAGPQGVGPPGGKRGGGMRAIQVETLGDGVAKFPRGHVHRHGFSRRAFLGGAAGTAAAGLLWRPRGAAAKHKGSSAPKPTTNVINLGGTDFHVTFFAPGVDPSVIWDFNGFAGVAQVQGTGTGTNPDGSTEPLLFDTDMRFMSGNYVAE